MVTGGTVGLGLETIRQLSRHHPSIIYLAARSKERSEAAIKQMRESEPDVAPVKFLQIDLSSFDSIRKAADSFNSLETRLDILVNNAGIMMTAEGLTAEGYEIQFGTNHMGHALFTQLLLPSLHYAAKTNPETRVVTLSSASVSMAPTDLYNLDEFKTTMSKRSTQARYTISKTANIHWARSMSEKHKDIKFIIVHPGMVATNLHHNASGMFLKMFLNTAIRAFATPVEKGALNQVWAAVSPEARSGGLYGSVGQAWKASRLAHDDGLRDQLSVWTQKEIDAYIRRSCDTSLH